MSVERQGEPSRHPPLCKEGKLKVPKANLFGSDGGGLCQELLRHWNVPEYVRNEKLLESPPYPSTRYTLDDGVEWRGSGREAPDYQVRLSAVRYGKKKSVRLGGNGG